MVFELGIKGWVWKAFKLEEEKKVHSRAFERVVESGHDKHQCYTCTVNGESQWGWACSKYLVRRNSMLWKACKSFSPRGCNTAALETPVCFTLRICPASDTLTPSPSGQVTTISHLIFENCLLNSLLFPSLSLPSSPSIYQFYCHFILLIFCSKRSGFLALLRGQVDPMWPDLLPPTSLILCPVQSSHPFIYSHADLQALRPQSFGTLFLSLGNFV